MKTVKHLKAKAVYRTVQ